MRFSADPSHIQVEITSKGRDVPADERARMQASLATLAEAVTDFPTSQLRINLIYHPRSAMHHAELALKLPGQTFFAGERGPYLDSAFHRALGDLVQKAQAYKERPDRGAVELAEHLAALDRDVVAPEGPEDGPLGEAVARGDYRAFHTTLSSYEEWLRKRVGRWVQRYPAAEARLGDGLLLGDLVEAVYLDAFERFPHRPTGPRFSEWLESLIDPALRAFLRHPDEERENASLARTLRQARVT
jgi:hypothetical protein